jgi:hypothetical protein
MMLIQQKLLIQSGISGRYGRLSEFLDVPSSPCRSSSMTLEYKRTKECTMNTRLQPDRIVATIALFSLLVLSMGLVLQPPSSARAASTTNPNYLAYATTGAQALQNTYNTSNGLFKTTGWWNSANALGAIIDYTSLTGDTSYTGDIATTFSKNSVGIS